MYLYDVINVYIFWHFVVMSDVFTEPVVLSKLKETNSQLEELVKFSKEQLSDLKRENSTK